MCGCGLTPTVGYEGVATQSTYTVYAVGDDVVIPIGGSGTAV